MEFDGIDSGDYTDTALLDFYFFRQTVNGAFYQSHPMDSPSCHVKELPDTNPYRGYLPSNQEHSDHNGGNPDSYAFERYPSKGLSMAYGLIVFSALIPGIVTARPLYDYLRSLKLVDTYPGLILLYTSSLIPFTILILRNYLGSIPIDIEEAAEIDGANHMQKLMFVTLPLMRPAVATVCIINFISCLNEFFIPLFFSQKIKVLTIGISTLPRANAYDVPWDLLSAMGCVILAPIIIFVMIFEENIMDGIMAGGVKA